MNEKNLIPNENRTPEERRANATKAGIASGKARKQKKKLKQALETIMSENVPANMTEIREMLHEFGVGEENATFEMALVISILKRALDGNTRSAELIVAILGQTAEHELKEREFAYKKKIDKQKMQQFDDMLADPSALIAVLTGSKEEERAIH